MMADKQGLVATDRVAPTTGSSAKDSKSTGPFELEAPQPSSTTSDHRRRSSITWALRYFLTVIIVAVALAVPVYIFRKDQVTEDDTLESAEDKQFRNLVFYLFGWLLITWLGACISDMIILAFPYLFRYVTGYLNPAYQRYWRIFRPLRLPVTLLGCLVASYVSFEILVNKNDLLLVNALEEKDPNAFYWDDVIDDVLQQSIYWCVGYALEKVLVLFITVHYHYRSDQVKNTHSKEMHEALSTLYETSIYLHPVNSPYFVVEDTIIRGAYGSESESHIRQGASAFLGKIGLDGHKIFQFFGNLKYNKSSHWLQSNSPYSVVERCLSNPKSAAALAKRIWMSLVVQGNEAFSAEDIAEVLGPYRRDEAKQIFKVIDENESGDIRLDEMVWTVVEAGRIRHAIYQGMADINHCINVFDWISQIILGALMVFFILLLYVQNIKSIQNTASYFVLGLSFAVGRTVHKYLSGCVYVFFEHPFDVGDRVNVYNFAATSFVSAVVTRQSILYTVFRRVDNGTDLQITNERLALKRVENISRSGLNRQGFSIFVDFKTSFKDLMFLRREMENFLAENPRDYQPTLGLSVVHVHDLSKLELAVGAIHKSNWSNERLRAVRCSKLMCALLAALRKIPINKPSGGKSGSGSEGNPTYTVQVTDAEAAEKRAAEKKKKADERIDAVKDDKPIVLPEDADEETRKKAKKAVEKAVRVAEEKIAEEEARKVLTVVPTGEIPRHDESEAASMGIDTLIKNVSTGLRANSATGPAGMFYQK